MTQIFGEIQMAFTSANDINILQASDAAVVGAGLGDDTYVLSPSTLSANQVIQISDTQGANKLQLIGGLTIASSSVASNAVLLTLSNGAKVTVLGADTFSYEVGGNPLTGVAGTVQTYAQFATTTLGAASVPAAGASPVSGSTNVTIPGGSTGGAGQTFTLTTATETKTLTAGNDTVDGSTTLDSISSDTIVDSSSTDTDTLNILINGAVDPTTVVNVENVNATAKYGAETINATKYVGVKTLKLDSSIASGSATVSNVSASAVATVKASTNISGLTVTSGSSGTGAGVAVDAGSATTLTLTGTSTKDDIFNLTLNGGSTGITATTMADSADKLAITGLSSTNTVTFAGTAAGPKTITVAGDQNVVLKGDSDVFKGNTITNSLSTGKTVDLVITAATSVSPDLSKAVVSSIELQAVSTGATFADNAKVKLNATGNLAVTAATGATALNLDLLQATTGQLTPGATAFTKVNISANTVAVTSLDARMGPSADVVLTGSKDVTLASTATSKSTDASALTGKLTATLDTDHLKLIGSAQDDTVTLANTSDLAYNVSTGNGADTITLATNNAKLTAAITIDGGAGTDTLKIGAAADLSDATGTEANSVITGIEVIDLNGNGFTLTQKQGFMLGNSFTVASSTSTPALTIKAVNSSGSGVLDASNVTVQGTASLVLTASGYTDSAASVTGSAFGDSLIGSAGADTIAAGSGADTVYGGKGADSISLTESVNLADKVVYTVGTTSNNAESLILGTTSTFTVSSSSSSATNVTGADVVTGAKAGDALVFLSGYTTGVAATASSTGLLDTLGTAAAVTADNSMSLIKGVYNSTAKSFYADAAGVDSLVVYDANTSTTAQEWQSIVLVGFAGSGTLTADTTDYAGVTANGFALTLA